MAPFQDSLESFEKALDQLKNSLHKDMKDPTILAGVVKHFELTYETCWKALKAYLAEKLGIQTMNPRDVFSAAFSNQLIKNDGPWLTMMKDRNASVHVYDQNDARQLVERISKTHFQELESLCQRIKK